MRQTKENDDDENRTRDRFKDQNRDRPQKT